MHWIHMYKYLWKKEEKIKEDILFFIIDFPNCPFCYLIIPIQLLQIFLVLILSLIIEKNDKSFIDIIINSFINIKIIIDYNDKFKDFQIFEKMNEMMIIIKDNINN